MQWVAVMAAPAALLAVCVSAIFLVTGWKRRRNWLEPRDGQAGATRFEPAPPSRMKSADLAAVVAGVLHRLKPSADERFVALEMAVRPDLVPDVSRPVLQEMLDEIVERAIEASLCGRVLVSAANVGGRVHTSISDDGCDADRAARASWLRQAQQVAALHDVTMDIDARPGQGSTVTLRFPYHVPCPAEAMRVTDPAAIWASAEKQARKSSINL
jgi:hypothetical protein